MECICWSRQSVQKIMPEQGFLIGHGTQGAWNFVQDCVYACICIFLGENTYISSDCQTGTWSQKIKGCKKSLLPQLVVVFQRSYHCWLTFSGNFLSPVWVFSFIISQSNVFHKFIPYKMPDSLSLPECNGWGRKTLAWTLGGLGFILTLPPGGFLTFGHFLAFSRLEFYHLWCKEIGLVDLNSETLLFLWYFKH